MNLERYKRCSAIARGLEKADFVLKNAKIVNVFTEEIIEGDIAIADGMIAGIGTYSGIREKDLNGKYVCPGFIDSHLHLESTLVTPKELISQAVLHGTTAFIVDPHESANVAGLYICPPELKNTVHVKAFTREKLKYTGSFPCHVIGMEEGQITTKDILEEDLCGDDPEGNGLPEKIAVVERHKCTGMVGVGFVKGYGLRCGAAASSVSHDSHNIIVIGDNDEDMELAVRELIRTQGGYTLVKDHQVYETLELPIMGLMTDIGFEKANEKLEKMIRKAHEMGVPKGMDPFIALSFMALPVIPEIRITPRGIYSVTGNAFYT